MKIITERQLEKFRNHLLHEEKSAATIKKYIKDCRDFAIWLYEKRAAACKEKILEYKAMLEERYAPTSVNAALSSLNSFFVFMDWNELRVRGIKIQKQMFTPAEKELTKHEYERLLKAAKRCRNKRLDLLMQTICATGIRVSELKFITVEAIKLGKVKISCKGKVRYAFLPTKLCKMLENFAEERKIKSGPVFVTRNGNPLDRSNIWSDMKKLCSLAGLNEEKVFPHNLRHLFARTYYRIEKDIVRLADILGHSSINTTRIYTMESGEIHRKQIQKIGQILLR